MFDNIDKDELIQSIINPLGGLNLSDSERKLLFFRHVGAEYAMASRRNRVPFASNIVRAGTAFSGLGGGTDPMMLLMLSGQLGGKKDEDKDKPSDMEVVIDAVDKLIQRVDKISKKVGTGSQAPLPSHIAVKLAMCRSLSTVKGSYGIIKVNVVVRTNRNHVHELGH